MIPTVLGYSHPASYALLLVSQVDTHRESQTRTGAMFPIGLILVVGTGAELFTGNVMYFSAAWLDRRVTLSQFLASFDSHLMSTVALMKSWIVSYLANFAGCAVLAYFGTYVSEIFEHDPWHAYIQTLGHKKVGLMTSVVHHCRSTMAGELCL
jgi:formate/nitrite transporter FocA (FNT family)